MSDRITQEFYCRHCPADDPASEDPKKRQTGGHFRCKLSLGFDASITLHCPKKGCRGVHTRHVINGVIHDGAGPGHLTEEVLKVGPSAWSRDPLSALQAKARRENPQDHYQADLRKGVVIAGEQDVDADWRATHDPEMLARWTEIGGRLQGAADT